MTRFDGKFEYLAAGRGVVRQGACQISFDERTVTLVGGGDALAFDLGDIDLFGSGDYELTLGLYSGDQIRLTQFGKAFQNLQSSLLAAYRDRLVRCLLVSDLDEVARFTARVRGAYAGREVDGPAEVRIYESNLAVLPDGARGFQWRLADLDSVAVDEREYAVVVARAGGQLAIGRLGKRTGELAERLRDRAAALAERSARSLHALFPFLSPDEFRRVASVLREGTSASIADLRAVHRLIEPTLLEKAVDVGLRPYIQSLLSRVAGGPWYAGYKVVRRDPDGEAEVEPDAEASATNEAEASAANEGADPAEAGRPDAAIVEVGDGLEMLYWFFFPVSAAGRHAPRLAWEASSRGGRATYVFRAGPGESIADAVGGVNRGLLALNFRRQPVYLKDDRLESDVRYRHYAIAARNVPELGAVRRALVGRAIHRTPESWASQIDRLLTE